MSQADAFLDTGYLPYGGGCPAKAGGQGAGIVGDCTPNQLWVISAVEPQKVADVDANGQLRSYGMVDGQNVVPAYRFRPEIGLGTYFAQLRVAIAAMQTDLGDEDMAGPGGFRVRLDPKRAYFASKYAHLFDKHIAFLTYRPAPDDPKPDGEGSSDYYRYVTHTNTSLSNAYYIALRRGEPGMSPQVWRLIDEMRDLLTYAQAHGTARGWRYNEPGYIAEALPSPSHGAVGFGPARGRALGPAFEAAQSQPGPDDVSTFLIGADGAGAARVITLKVQGGQGVLDASRPPFWIEPGLTGLISTGGAGVVGVTDTDQMLLGVEGANAAFSPVAGGPGFALVSPKGLFGGGDGVLYGIGSQDALIWTRVSPAGVAAPAKTVGTGWGGFRQVVGAGSGVIYAVTQGGDLLWYRHMGFLDGSVAWQGPYTVAHGFDRYVRLVAAAGGVLVGVRAGGSADYFHHRDWLTGVSGGEPPPGPTVQSGGEPTHRGPVGTRPFGARPLPEAVQGPSAHIAGPIPLSGASLADFPVTAGELDVTQGSGRIN